MTARSLRLFFFEIFSVNFILLKSSSAYLFIHYKKGGYHDNQ